MVELRLYGSLWEHLERSQELALQGQEVSVADLLDRLGIDSEQVGIVTIDGRVKPLDALIPTTCRLCVFQPMSGG